MYSTMSAEDLGDFVNLQELSIQLQHGAARRGGLPAARPRLQRLCDHRLRASESVAGVEACVQLRHLDVSQNRIEEMDPNVLQYLEELRTLWMNDNRLTRIEGLEPLTKLTTLWLARNQIAFICDALDNNLALTDLNLSANLVGNFKDIPHLSRLRHLKSLSFGDPHYGECPVCALCNYQTTSSSTSTTSRRSTRSASPTRRGSRRPADAAWRARAARSTRLRLHVARTIRAQLAAGSSRRRRT